MLQSVLLNRSVDYLRVRKPRLRDGRGTCSTAVVTVPPVKVYLSLRRHALTFFSKRLLMLENSHCDLSAMLSAYHRGLDVLPVAKQSARAQDSATEGSRRNSRRGEHLGRQSRGGAPSQRRK